MATLRVRLELNKGRVGMPLAKLAQVCAETTRFLNLLCEDMDLPVPAGGWLAESFENASVDFDLRYPEQLSEELAELGRRGLHQVLGDGYDDPEVAFRIRTETRRQYRHIGSALDIDERAHFGVYRNGEARPDQWYALNHASPLDVAEGVVDRGAYGEVQGRVNAFFAEHSPPYLRIRELSTGGLVKCYFDAERHSAAVELMNDRDAIVFVEGWIKEDTATGRTCEIRAEDFRLAPAFDLDLYQRMLGSMPLYGEGTSPRERMTHGEG